jgi:hypothetical protein
MIGFSRMLWCSLLVLSVGAGLCLLRPGWLAAVGLDFGDVGATMSGYTDELERGRGLDEAREEILGRVKGRERVVQEAIDRRLTLVEAAARFRELDRADPSFLWDSFRVLRPGASDEERQCQSVIEWVSGMLVNDPGRARAESRRLEEELQAVLSHGPQRPRKEGSDH